MRYTNKTIGISPPLFDAMHYKRRKLNENEEDYTTMCGRPDA